MKNLIAIYLIFNGLFLSSSYAITFDDTELCIFTKGVTSSNRIQQRINSFQLSEMCEGFPNGQDGTDFFCLENSHCTKIKTAGCITTTDASLLTRFENTIKAMNKFEGKNIIPTKICFADANNINECEIHVSEGCEDIRKKIAVSPNPPTNPRTGTDTQSLSLKETVRVFNEGYNQELFLTPGGLFNFKTTVAPEGIHIAGINTNPGPGTLGGLNVPVNEKYVQFVAPISKKNTAMTETLELLNSNWGHVFTFTPVGQFETTLAKNKVWRFALTYKKK